MSEEKPSAMASMPRSSGVLKGAVSYAKFRVAGELPEDLHQKFMARLRTRAFRPLAPEDEDDVGVGWVPIERPYDEEVVFRTDGVFFGHYLNLGMRLDVWRFPAALVKSKMVAAERAWKQKTGKERLSRTEKAELRDMVERKLRRDGIPTTKVVDFSWDVETNILRFFGRSKVVLEHFFELFEKTFSVKLIPAGAYTTGMLVDPPLSRALQAQLVVVEPTLFHHARGVS